MKMRPPKRKMGPGKKTELEKRQAWQKNWPKNKEIAERIYNGSVKPFLPELEWMARKFSGGNETVAADMLALAELKIMSGAETFDNKRPLKPFVLSIARNEMISVARKEKNYKQLFKFFGDEFFSFIAGNEPQPRLKISTAERAQIAKFVENALEKTRVEKKAKGIFTFYCGLQDGKVKGYQQVADHFKIPLGSVKSSIYSTRKALKRNLKENKAKTGSYFPE